MTDWYKLRHRRDGAIGVDPANGKRIGALKRPFAWTPQCDFDLVGALLDRDDLTIEQLRDAINFAPDLREILTVYVNDGWGHLRGRDVFSWRGR